MRIVAVSDTHNNHPATLPDGDLLIHCGDFSNYGRDGELVHFNEWLRQKPHEHKLVVPGNHDLSLQSAFAHASSLLSAADVVIDELVVIQGLRIYCSPWTPLFGNWAFMYDTTRGDPYAEAPGADIVVTHGPARGILDLNFGGIQCGDPNLIAYLDRHPPRLHVFGHIHEAHGRLQRVVRGKETLHANVAYAGNRSQPLVFDIDA
jgi:Icc-related predicted phosphoesterase